MNSKINKILLFNLSKDYAMINKHKIKYKE